MSSEMANAVVIPKLSVASVEILKRIPEGHVLNKIVGSLWRPGYEGEDGHKTCFVKPSKNDKKTFAQEEVVIIYPDGGVRLVRDSGTGGTGVLDAVSGVNVLEKYLSNPAKFVPGSPQVEDISPVDSGKVVLEHMKSRAKGISLEKEHPEEAAIIKDSLSVEQLLARMELRPIDSY